MIRTIALEFSRKNSKSIYIGVSEQNIIGVAAGEEEEFNCFV